MESVLKCESQREEKVRCGLQLVGLHLKSVYSLKELGSVVDDVTEFL